MRHRALIAIPVLLVLVGAGCAKPAVRYDGVPSAGANANAAVPVVETGVRGTVIVGPTCPVERVPPDPACAPRPLAIGLIVTQKGKEAARGESGADGMFSFRLPPGTYSIAKAPGGPALPRVVARDFTVDADGYAQITVEADSGIR